MIYSIRDYQVPDHLKKNVHLLGVGNHDALLPFIVTPDYFDFIENLSYDSTSHTSSWFFSRYRNKDWKQCVMEIPARAKKTMEDIHKNDLIPVIREIMEINKKAFDEFEIYTPEQLINDSTKWSIYNKTAERKFIRPGGEHGYRLLMWFWVTNTIEHFIDELQRKINNPVDVYGLSIISTYNDFRNRWLPRQRVPEKVPEHWPVRLDV